MLNEDNEGFMTAYKNTGEAKIVGIIEFIETLLENGAKFLLYAHHMAVMGQLETYLLRKRIGYIRIDGHVSPE